MSTMQDTRLDPVTYEVIRHRLWSINDEACTTMVHASGSPVVHASDYNFAMYTPAGDMAVVGMLYMIPVGTMSVLVKLILERFPDSLAPGDVFFCNDPYLAAAHQNDVQVVAPFFHDGRLAGWTGACSHQLDVGGMEPGSWCPRATDVFQEGLRVPPVRLRAGGVRQDDVYSILLGASRLPFMFEMDLTAMIAANEVAHRRLADLHERYGSAQVVQAMATSLDQSEAAVREALRELPDGCFRHTDYLDHDGHSDEIYDITCVLTKTGDRLVIDLSESSGQAPGFVNSTRPATIGAVISGLFPLLGASTPAWNDGIMRPIEIVLAEGTIVHPVAPAPVSASSVAAAWVASHAVVAALSKLVVLHPTLGEEATATSDGCWPLLNIFGVNRFGEPFGDMFLDPVAWGGGAYRERDGVDAGGALIAPTAHILDVETKENAVPVLYLWRRERPDSGGPGRHRGGTTTEFAVTPYGVAGMAATLATHGVAQPNCAGLFGGFPGSTSGYQFVRGTGLFADLAEGTVPTSVAELSGEHVAMSAKPPMFQFVPGDVINVLPQGGGGFGDPLDRDTDRVAEDLRDGRVSPEIAAAVYGVVLTGPGRIDEASTGHRRRDARRRRLAAAGPAPATSDTAAGPRATGRDVAGAVTLHGAGDDRYVACGGCGQTLGQATEDWQRVLRPLDVAGTALGGMVSLDERMAVTARLCPTCGRALSVVVNRRGSVLAAEATLAPSRT